MKFNKYIVYNFNGNSIDVLAFNFIEAGIKGAAVLIAQGHSHEIDYIKSENSGDIKRLKFILENVTT